MKRRSFLQQSSYATLAVLSPKVNASLYASDFLTLDVLHTNDMHSRIDPFPMDGSRNAGLGGVGRRAALIEKIREKAEHVLLVDSGDIFQGTPYFNQFNGQVEMEVMNAMGYDYATIGNHDFDGGMDNLVTQMEKANFQCLSANYDFSDTPFAPLNKNYSIQQFEGVKVGVFGLGIQLDGLVPAALYRSTLYLDPIVQARKTAAALKKEHKCDFVVCLSHLGYKYKGGKVSDVVLAQNSTDIDLILGGHTHTFMDEPDQVANLDGKPVIIHQSGWAGILLGHVQVQLERGKGCPKMTVGQLDVG